MVEPYQLYAPLFTLKPVAPDLWIVDGGTIRMSWLGLRIPFPTRMTVVRLRDGGLWLHSPVALTPELRDTVTRLGPVRYLVSPNKIHYWWIGSWREAFPEALACGLPEAAPNARHRGVVFDRMLGSEADPAWAGEIDQVLVPGAYLTEAVFLHRASCTAILADLIENFELQRLASPFWRFLVRLSGAAAPRTSRRRAKKVRRRSIGTDRQDRRAHPRLAARAGDPGAWPLVCRERDGGAGTCAALDRRPVARGSRRRLRRRARADLLPPANPC